MESVIVESANVKKVGMVILVNTQLSAILHEGKVIKCARILKTSFVQMQVRFLF